MGEYINNKNTFDNETDLKILKFKQNFKNVEEQKFNVMPEDIITEMKKIRAKSKELLKNVKIMEESLITVKMTLFEAEERANQAEYELMKARGNAKYSKRKK